MRQASIRTIVTIVGILVLAVAGINLFRFIEADESELQQQAYIAPTGVPNDAHAYIFPISETSYIPFLDSTRPRPQLTAKSALVYDTQSSRFLYAADSKKQLPIASLTKIMTAVIAIEHLRLDDVVTVGKESVRVDGEKQDLYNGEKITVGDLLQFMLIDSSNDAAYALGTHAKSQGLNIVKLMNDKARELAMHDTLFLDPAGLSDNGHATAQDLVKLVVYALRYNNEIWKPLQLEEVTINSEDGKISHRVQNTNQLLETIPNIQGGKTGYTDGALGCMILIVDIPGHRDKIVTVILGSKERFGDTKALVDWINDAYRWE